MWLVMANGFSVKLSTSYEEFPLLYTAVLRWQIHFEMSIYIFFSAELWNTFPLTLNWDAFHISNQTVASNPRYFILLPEGCATAKL